MNTDAMLYCGTDATNETDCASARCTPLTALRSLRFALMTVPELAGRIGSDIRRGQPVQLGTEYPRTCRRYFPDLPPPMVWSGKSEGMIAYYQNRSKRPLAIFGLIDSGDTVAANGLTVIEDDIETVYLQEVQVTAARQYFDDKSSITTRIMVS